MPDDRVTAALAEMRERAAATKTSAHGYVPRGEFIGAGLAGEWVVANIAAAADTPRLVAAVQVAVGRHQPMPRRPQMEGEPARPVRCRECLQHWPCPEYRDLSRALLGEEAQSA